MWFDSFQWHHDPPISLSYFNHLQAIDLTIVHIDGLVQERRNSSALAMELPCTNLSIYFHLNYQTH